MLWGCFGECLGSVFLLLQVLEPLTLFQVAGKGNLPSPFLLPLLPKGLLLLAQFPLFWEVECMLLCGYRFPSHRVRVGHHPTLGVDQDSPEPQGLAAVCHFPSSHPR